MKDKILCMLFQPLNALLFMCGDLQSQGQSNQHWEGKFDFRRHSIIDFYSEVCH